MKGTVSFHPVDTRFFDELVAPLLSGGKVNPEAFLTDGLKIRGYWDRARRYARGLETVLRRAELPRPEPGAGLLRSLRAHLERFDHRLDETTRLVVEKVDPDLHLYGRPFFITEGSATRVAERTDEYLSAHNAETVDDLALEQILRLGPDLGRAIQPEDGPDLSADLAYRGDLLTSLKDLYDIAQAARKGETWGGATERARRPAMEVLKSEVPWRAVRLHSRRVPFWVGRDVDGLETICRAAEISPPDVLVPAWRLFAQACEEFPALKEALEPELRGPRDVGAFVSAGDLPELISFLNASGARIIQAAARHGEGPMCTTLLRKIRECAAYAERRGFGYLEASGILPPDLGEEGQEPEE